MTIQEIIYNSRAKRKLQAGGTAAGVTTEGIAGDLSKKTIRDEGTVNQAQGIPGAAPSPSLAGGTQQKGLLPGSKNEPVHVIIDEGGGGIGGGGGGLTGMVNNFAGKLLGKGLGAAGSIFSKIKNRNQPQQPVVPTAQQGGLLVKKKVPKGQFGIQPQNPWTVSNVAAGAGDLSKTSSAPTGGGGMGAMNIAGAGAQIADMAGNALEAFKPTGPINTWGIETQTKKGNRMAVGASALKGVGKGAGVGATIGSFAGPVGTAIGAGIGALVGGVTGLLKGRKKVKTEAKEIKDSTDLAYSGFKQNLDANVYGSLAKPNYAQSRSNVAKAGAKLAIKEKLSGSKKNAISWHGRTFKLKAGGKLDAVGEVNIIPAGTLHKENNNLGQKDKGIPIVDGDGKKVFEVEREELILRLKTTKAVEDMVEKYKKSHNDKHLVDLGKLLSEEIMTNTHDFSGRHGLEVK